ncbi:hypothetical protein IQ06DRAFT_155120 [Phaeosphaeriaceae sp. SRC1lsM3a]|nr:hypothetical protein IQ06DRAFT_155120 [Stagonospora sp. SRC1lsM3a]
MRWFAALVHQDFPTSIENLQPVPLMHSSCRNPCFAVLYQAYSTVVDWLQQVMLLPVSSNMAAGSKHALCVGKERMGHCLKPDSLVRSTKQVHWFSWNISQ